MRKNSQWWDIASFTLVIAVSVIAFAVLYEASKLIVKDMSRL